MKKTFAALFIFFIGYPLLGQDTGSGMDFLNIGPSPRLLSISEAGTATLTGPSAIYTNPALLVFEEKSSVDLSYTLWISNVNNQFAAANFKRERSAIGLGVYSSVADNFEARNQPGPSAGSFSINYLSLAGSYAYKLGPVSVGLTAQYLREEVFQFMANGYAFNAGIASEVFDGRVRMGVSVTNLGKMESLDILSTPLPSAFNVGITAGIIEINTPGLNDFPALISAHLSFSHPLEDFSTTDFTDVEGDEGFINTAISIEAAEMFSIQAGYRFRPTERPLSFGLGLIIDPIRVNYALLPFSTGFGVVHSFGLQYYF